MAYLAISSEWSGMTGSSRQPVSVEKPGKTTGEPRWDWDFLGGLHQNGEKLQSRWAFKVPI